MRLMRSIFLLMIMLGFEGVASDALSQRRLPSSQTELHLSFAPLVKKAAPAVVNIFTKKTVRSRSFSPLFDDPFFRRFFGKSFQFGPRERQKFKILWDLA